MQLALIERISETYVHARDVVFLSGKGVSKAQGSSWLIPQGKVGIELQNKDCSAHFLEEKSHT